MVNEIRLRQELDVLRLMPGAPIRRAKAFVRFAKRAELAQSHMLKMSAAFFAGDDRLRGAMFCEAGRRMGRLCREARNCARAALRAKPLTYGYEPRDKAYPTWNLARAVEREEAKA